jgi:hypothetical protein
MTLELSRLARRLRAFLWIALWGPGAMSGCVLPQNYQTIDDIAPTVTNRPPRILNDSAQPGLVTVVDVGSECTLTFRANVEDPDVDSVGLRVNWFIDWSQSNPSPYREDETIEPVQGEVRGKSVELSLILTSAGNPLRTLGEHVVEVLVADGEIRNREPQQSYAPDGGIINPRYADSHAWFVSVKSTDCSP